MLIITNTKTINTDNIAVIKIDHVADNNFYIMADRNVIVGRLSEPIAHKLYDDIIYSITSGKKSFNVSLHLGNIFKMYDIKEVVL